MCMKYNWNLVLIEILTKNIIRTKNYQNLLLNNNFNFGQRPHKLIKQLIIINSYVQEIKIYLMQNEK